VKIAAAETPVDLAGTGRAGAWRAFAVWTGVVAIYAVALHRAAGLPLAYAVLAGAVNIYSLAAITAAAARLATRWELWRLPAARAVAIHLALAAVAIGAWFALQVAYVRLTVGPGFWAVVYENSWVFQILTAAAIYGAAIGLTLTLQSMRRESARAQREAQLELTARQGELSALKGQIQPHFLLNSLNSVLALLDESPDEARRMLLRLGSLLQSTFERMELPAVPLAGELDMIRDYLEVEQVRYGDRLEFAIEAGPDVTDIPVPPFILQPIVENAIKHGVERRAARGHVFVGARRVGGTLELSVRDSGGGFAGEAPRTGRGIELTERRLAALYGDRAALRFSHEAAGFTARLTLPVDA